MNKKTDFEFRFYNTRWKHNDTYSIKYTKTGWHVSHIAINGECTPDGSPVLYDNFKQDFIGYPENLKGEMESIWEEYREDHITADEVQKKLDLLGEWVSVTTKARPHLWD